MVNMPSDNAQPGLVTEVLSFERGFARIFTEGLASKQAGRQAGRQPPLQKAPGIEGNQGLGAQAKCREVVLLPAQQFKGDEMARNGLFQEINRGRQQGFLTLGRTR